jgi:hypothetical protein
MKKVILLPPKREYKYNNDNEILNSGFVGKLHTNIIDYRFFEVQNFNTPIAVIIYNPYNLNQKILDLLSELEVCIISTKNISESINIDIYLEDEGVNPERPNFEVILEKGILTAKEMIKNCLSENLHKQHLTLQPPRPKIIIYTDDDTSIENYFYLLNIIQSETKANPELEISVLTNESIMTGLHRGMNKIFLPNCLFTKKGIGLLPLQDSIISTNGLTYEVKDWQTKWGSSNVSTSNETDEDNFEIIVHEGSIVFTAELTVDNFTLLKN